MDYLKLQFSYVTSVEWRRASCAARGAACSLLGYCFRVENGGIIRGAQGWLNRDWLPAADITMKDVRAAVEAGLATWEGHDLRVMGYDEVGEARLSIQREQGHHGAKGGRPQKQKPLPQTQPDNPKGFGKITPSPVQTIPAQPRPDHPTAQATAAADADPFAGITKPDPTAGPKRRHNLGDLEACYAVLVIFREDRHRAETTLELYGWEACQAALNELGPPARKRDPGKQRVTISEMAKWLEANYRLTDADWKRAGIEAPPSKEPAHG